MRSSIVRRKTNEGSFQRGGGTEPLRKAACRYGFILSTKVVFSSGLWDRYIRWEQKPQNHFCQHRRAGCTYSTRLSRVSCTWHSVRVYTCVVRVHELGHAAADKRLRFSVLERLKGCRLAPSAHPVWIYFVCEEDVGEANFERLLVGDFCDAALD